MSKLYIIPITLTADIPLDYVPIYLSRGSVEINGNTLAYAKVKANDEVPGLHAHGWAVITTDTPEKAIPQFMQYDAASLSHGNVTVQLDNVKLAFTHDNMMSVDFDEMVMDVLTVFLKPDTKPIAGIEPRFHKI